MKLVWEEILKDRLQLYGHRNWFVIADSAYPAQSRPAIETIVADEEQTTVLERTSAILGGCTHIKPNIYADEELAFVREEEAPGISSYRERLGACSPDPKLRVLPHEIMRSSIALASCFECASNQNQHANSVYIRVFELDCGYWNAQGEKRLRAAMKSRVFAENEADLMPVPRAAST
jgi:hypothetical protein